MNLLELKAKMVAVEKEKEKYWKAYQELSEQLDAMKKEEKKLMHLMDSGVNLDRYSNAKRFISFSGAEYVGHGDTRKCIDDAIDDIASKQFHILKEYFACKDYAGWHCQREDHQYYYGPKHGSVVFEIAATVAWRCEEIQPTDEDLCDILYVLNLIKAKKLEE